MSTNKLLTLKYISTNATKKHTASLIFLHGSGDNGSGIRDWLRAIAGKHYSFPHIKIIYPSAAVIPYTAHGGTPSQVWFDRHCIDQSACEQVDSMTMAAEAIDQIVEEEITKFGIHKDRIIVGGFSMGGAMSMYYGYLYGKQLAGVFGLSSFLNDNSSVYKEVKAGERLPDLFQGHGIQDELVPLAWGHKTSEKLTQLGVKSTFNSYNILHEMNSKEMNDLNNWIDTKLPQ